MLAETHLVNMATIHIACCAVRRSLTCLDQRLFLTDYKSVRALMLHGLLGKE
jgi:hypothetical protein